MDLDAKFVFKQSGVEPFFGYCSERVDVGLKLLDIITVGVAIWIIPKTRKRGVIRFDRNEFLAAYQRKSIVVATVECCTPSLDDLG